MDRQKEQARLEEACRDKHWEDTNTTLPYGPHRTRILESTKGHLAGTSEAKTLRSDPPASLTLFFWNFVAHHQDKPEETREEAWDETCFGPASCSKDEVSNHVWSANGERMLDSWLGSFPCVQCWSCYCNLWLMHRKTLLKAILKKQWMCYPEERGLYETQVHVTCAGSSCRWLRVWSVLGCKVSLSDCKAEIFLVTENSSRQIACLFHRHRALTSHPLHGDLISFSFEIQFSTSWL